ncbi:MAG: NAD(P)H-flavin reductase [Legionellaceae bacterium]|nr:NAD(P)H-flavin reductase [Legionellaceae bacterium]
MTKKLVHADVEFITPLTDSVLQFIIKPDTYIDYQAGQYLQIMMDSGACSYSIANAPLGSHRYELHIRHSRDNVNSQALLSDMKRNGRVQLSLPFGDCAVHCLDQKKPIIFIAAGTGFAPIKAIIEQLFADDDPRNMTLYWGVNTESDLYMDEQAMQWHKHARHFSYVSHTSKSGKKTLISLILQQHAQDLLEHQIVMSGPFDLMYTLRDALIAEGVARENLFSDAFSFEGE